MTDEEIVESIIQIASSFGISCDDASYIAKSFENFGKEYMMSNIEDDANVLGAFCLAGRIEIISPEEFEEVKIAISNILSEREQDKARIKELEEENKRKDMFLQMAKEVIENSIPKQKVKNTLDDIYDYFERLNGPDEDIEYIESKRKELLEGE